MRSANNIIALDEGAVVERVAITRAQEIYKDLHQATHELERTNEGARVTAYTRYLYSALNEADIALGAALLNGDALPDCSWDGVTCQW